MFFERKDMPASARYRFLIVGVLIALAACTSDNGNASRRLRWRGPVLASRAGLLA